MHRQFILDFVNKDTHSIVTPINLKVYENLLRESQYDEEESKFLLDGFTQGFDVGYRGPWNRCDTANNIPLQVGTRADVWEKIMKEVEHKRYAGPFERIPYKRGYIQSPIGLVPKAGNQTRLIFHLSYDFKKSGHRSLNFHTPSELCSIKYNDLDCAVETSIHCMENASGVCVAKTLPLKSKGMIYYSKTDLKSAFRILPLKRRCYRWVILKAYHPTTGKLYYFLEKNLPFRASISCSHFQRFSDSLRHIFEHLVGAKMVCVNYLDDYLFCAPSQTACNKLVRKFLLLCKRMNVPVALEKTKWATTKITFLGMQLDGVEAQIRIPEDKRIKALNWIQFMMERKKATIKQLEQLTGLLNFIGRAIVPGRAFTRKMYAKYSKLTEEKVLRKYHHISLDGEFKSDCKVWQSFLLSNDSGMKRISRPFIDVCTTSETSETLFFYSDATANPDLGYGVIFGPHWIVNQWEHNFIKEHNPSIEFLELFALCVGVFTWAEQLRNCRITIFCDNQSSLAMVNNYTSGCKYCMMLIRELVLKSLRMNFRIFVEYVSSRDNFLSDSLSRLKFTEFFNWATEHEITVDTHPTEATGELWPLSVWWKENCSSLK